MADQKTTALSSFVVCGLTPEGVKARAADLAINLSADMNVEPWEYGSILSLSSQDDAELEKAVISAFSPFIYEFTSEPGSILVKAAVAASITVVMAESCTGGMAGELVTAVSGSSDIFWGSMVTYANSAKERILGVDTLKDYGAVSEETVRSMTAGALRVSGADAALAVSGIAGPGGGTPAKPVGTVWFSFEAKGQSTTLCCRFSGDRENVRKKAAATALAGCANQIGSPLLDTSWIGRYTFY